MPSCVLQLVIIIYWGCAVERVRVLRQCVLVKNHLQHYRRADSHVSMPYLGCIAT